MSPTVTSKITARSQTTLPPSVRAVLGLAPGERLGYVILGDEVRLVNPANDDHADAALAPFLALVQQHITHHPDRLAALPADLVARARTLTRRVTVDHEAPLDGPVTL